MSKLEPCSLNHLPSGRRAKILRVVGGAPERGRLCALGLTPNTPVDILDCSAGRQTVRVRGCNMVLDTELTGCIICEPAE